MVHAYQEGLLRLKSISLVMSSLQNSRFEEERDDLHEIEETSPNKNEETKVYTTSLTVLLRFVSFRFVEPKRRDDKIHQRFHQINLNVFNANNGDL